MKKLLLLIVFMSLASPSFAQVNLGASTSSNNPQRSGDATTGLYSPAGGQVAMTSSGTEIMRVTGSGVAIGTTVAGNILTIQGSSSVANGVNIELLNTNASNTNPWFLGTGGGVIASSASSIGDGVDYKMTFLTNGDVGIATTAPHATLSLGGQVARIFDMVRETTAATAGNDLTVEAGGAVSGGTNLNGGNLNLASGISTGTGTSGINFKVYEAGSSGTADNSATTAMTITGGGNVGIGTTSPLTRLHIAGTGVSAGDGVEVQATGTGGHNYRIWPSDNNNAEPSGGLYITDTTSGAFNDRISLNSSGQMGIGTANPNRTLHIYASDAALGIQDSTAGGHEYVITNDNAGDGSTGLYDQTSTAFRWLVNSSGNIGIGTTSPRGGSTLDVNGKVYVATFAANSSTTGRTWRTSIPFL